MYMCPYTLFDIAMCPEKPAVEWLGLCAQCPAGIFDKPHSHDSLYLPLTSYTDTPVDMYHIIFNLIISRSRKLWNSNILILGITLFFITLILCLYRQREGERKWWKQHTRTSICAHIDNGRRNENDENSILVHLLLVDFNSSKSPEYQWTSSCCVGKFTVFDQWEMWLDGDIYRIM